MTLCAHDAPARCTTTSRAALVLLLVSSACGGGSPPPRDAIDRVAVTDTRLADAHVANRDLADATAVTTDAAVAPISIIAVGDLMMGSTYPVPALPPDDGHRLLAAVTPLLSGADLAFGNLEGPLYEGREPPHCTPGGIAERHGGGTGRDCWSFRMPVPSGALLRDAGFDVVSIANNHIDDFGEPGRASTIATLDQLGIAHSGPLGTVAHLTVRGRSVDLIAFATDSGLNDLDDLQAARALVSRSLARGSLVIVSFHGGAEGVTAQHVPDGAETFWGQRRGAVKVFAHAMIDAGASLVIGHGPHVVRGMEIRRGRLIAYSLGTFASYRGINVAGVLGVTLLLEVRIAADGRLLGGTLHSVRQRAPGGPELDADRQAVRAVRMLSNTDFPTTQPTIAEDGTITAP